METPKQANLKLSGISLLKTEMSELYEILPPDYLFNYLMINSIALNEATREAVVFVDITITSLSDDEIKFGAIKTAIHFIIDNYNDVVVNNALPQQVAYMLVATAFTTTRGIMYGEFRGTPLHNALLPLVDITKSEIFPNLEKAKQSIAKPKPSAKKATKKLKS